MALPVTISSVATGPQNSYHGPFKSSGGAFYTILLDSADKRGIEAYKATDPTSSFTEQDGGNRPLQNVTVLSMSSHQDGDNLHFVNQDAGDEVYYSRFDMANDIWDNLDGGGARRILVQFIDTGANACDITVLSAAYGVGSAFVKIRVVYQGATDMDMGSSFDRIDESNSVDDGENWSTATSIDGATGGAGVHYTGPRIVKHPSDDQCFIFFSAATDVIQRAIAGDNTLRTYRDTGFGSFNITTYALTHGIGFTRASTPKVRIGYRKVTTADFEILEFDAFTDDTNPTETTSNVPGGDVEVDTSSIVACLAVDGSTIRGFMVESLNNDLFEFDDGDADSYTVQGTAHLVGTLKHISCNVYDRSGTKLAMIYDDGGTVKYDEIDLGGAPAAGPPLGSLALMGIGR